jgi:hypothetical protein
VLRFGVSGRFLTLRGVFSETAVFFFPAEGFSGRFVGMRNLSYTHRGSRFGSRR